MAAKKAAKKKTVKKSAKKAGANSLAEISEEEEGETTTRLVKVRERVKAILGEEQVLTEDSDPARDLYAQGRYGENEKGRIQMSLLEALYLVEKEKLTVTNLKSKPYTTEALIRKAKQLQKGFWTRYVVYRDMRNRGYIVKTALKFGADFRVYDRGVKPGEDHAKWVLFPIHESQALTWHDFAAKNRVAHSTKKRLLLAIVDEESDVTYYEVAWKRP